MRRLRRFELPGLSEHPLVGGVRHNDGEMFRLMGIWTEVAVALSLLMESAFLDSLVAKFSEVHPPLEP